MWKVFLAFGTHRFLLLAIALFAINLKTTPVEQNKKVPPLQPPKILLQHFMEKASLSPEVVSLDEFRAKPFFSIFKEVQNPFLWMARTFSAAIPVPSVWIVLLLANAFLFFALWELYSLVERLAIPEVAVGAACFLVLWITSYELSLGSSLSLSTFFVCVCLRHSVDNQWGFVGAGLGLLAITEPMALGLLPLLLFIFWYFQRGTGGVEITRGALYLILPTACAVFLRWPMYMALESMVHGSALFNIFDTLRNAGQWTWALTQSNLGQTISIAFFFVGAVCAAIVNTSFLYRFIPMYVLFLVLATSPYGTVASRLCLSGVCLGGISSVCSPIGAALVQAALIFLGGFEVFTLFTAG